MLHDGRRVRGDERRGWGREGVGRGDWGAGEVVRVDAREVRERGERGERGFGDERERRRERVRVGFEGEKASGKDVRARGAADGVRDERARGSRVRRRRGRRRSRVGRENGE